ncbi:hypothetical protein ACQY0O_000159 [Thecaphora frezii]
MKNYSRNLNLKTGITVGIFGAPNVRKSSLINSLKRARVSARKFDLDGTARSLLHHSNNGTRPPSMATRSGTRSFRRSSRVRNSKASQRPVVRRIER